MSNSYTGWFRSFYALTLLLIFGASTASAQWTEVGSMGSQRTFPQTAAINDKVYVFGGAAASYLTTAEVYDVTSQKWSPIASMPEFRFAGYAGTVNGKIYLIGGAKQAGTSVVYNTTVLEYDPVTDFYTPKASMPVGTAWFTGATVGTNIYVIGGSNAGGVTAATWMYDVVANSWQQISDAPYGAGYYMTSASNGSDIYLVGGRTNSSIFRAAYKGTPAGGNITWTALANYPITIDGAASGFVNGKLVVAGGETLIGSSLVPTDACYMLDPVTGAWGAFYPLPVATYYSPTMPGDGITAYYLGGNVTERVFKATEGPAIAVAVVSNKKFAVAFQKGATSSKIVTFEVKNRGIAPLTGTNTVAPGAAWLKANPASISVQPGNYTNVGLNINPTGLDLGTYNSTVTLATNDPTNPQITIDVTAYVVDNLVEQPTAVVCEEGSGDWCGYCPYGADSLVALKRDQGDRAIVISYHGGSTTEPMQFSIGTQTVSRLGLPGWPSASIQRVKYPGETFPMINRGLWRQRANEILAARPIAPMALSLENYSYDEATGKLTATLKMDVSAPVIMNSSTTLNVNAVITQDSIIYSQTFYPPTGGSVQINPYTNYHVARAGWPSAIGQQVALPPGAVQDGVLLPGTVITQNISFNVGVSTNGDPRLAFKPEESRFVVFAHLDDPSGPQEILQGLERDLMGAPAAAALDVKTAVASKNGNVEDDLALSSTVKNLTTSPVDLTVERIDNGMPNFNWKSWFCINSDCGTENDNILNATLAANETANIAVHIFGGNAGKGTVTLKFTANGQSYTQMYSATVTASSVADAAVTGTTLTLDQNMPNPATDLTRFEYFVPTSGTTTVEVFTVTGQKMLSVVNGRQEKGIHAVSIDVATLPNGTYNVVLSNNGVRVARTMTVVH